jgi:hypothetical protein
MIHILKKIADWIVEEEMNSSTDCSISDEIIDEWLETIEEHKKKIEQNHGVDSEQYDMIVELDKKVKQIKELRRQKCQH